MWGPNGPSHGRTHLMKHTLPLFNLALLSLGAGLLAVGCSTSSPPPRDLMAEEARRGGTVERPIAMRGETSFADGQVKAVATVSRGFSRGPGRHGPVPESKRRFFRRDTDAFSENYNFDYYGDSEEEQKEAVKDYVRQAMARRAAGSPMPPVTLQVYFENTGKEPVEIAPTEVNSDLGNFAARPSTITVPPGERVSLDPMVSQLGVMADELPLTLGVRIGGKRESQVVTVKNVLSAAALEEAK